MLALSYQMILSGEIFEFVLRRSSEIKEPSQGNNLKSAKSKPCLSYHATLPNYRYFKLESVNAIFLRDLK